VGDCVYLYMFIDGESYEPSVFVNVVHPIQPYPSLLITYLRRSRQFGTGKCWPGCC
jgi:hypothetical protein